jgi:hypothetical protein
MGVSTSAIPNLAATCWAMTSPAVHSFDIRSRTSKDDVLDEDKDGGLWSIARLPPFRMVVLVKPLHNNPNPPPMQHIGDVITAAHSQRR